MQILGKCLIGFLLFYHFKCQAPKFEYNIEIPKYKCDNEDEFTTIRLSGKDAQNLDYKWEVYFTANDRCSNQQRCTLLAWKSVRDLETHLNQVCSTKKCGKEINIMKTMLLPDIQYILDITILYNGDILEKRRFILECARSVDLINMRGASPRSDNHLRKALVTLTGSNITYADIEYVLKADVTLYDADINYYFQWELLDNFSKLISLLPTKGSILHVFPKVLLSTKTYIINCNLIETSKDESMAMATQTFKVLKRGMVLKLVVIKLVVGAQKPFKLSAYLYIGDNGSEKVQIQWLCTASNSRECTNFKSTNETFIEISGFPDIGRYNISIEVTQGNEVKKDLCIVDVIKDGFSRIDVDDIHEPSDPTQEIVVPVFISFLITGCTLQWACLQQPGYQYLDLHQVPGNVYMLLNITVREDEFLNEIDDFSNKTSDKNYDLRIPPAQGNWKGLESLSRYLFRVNVVCPILQDGRNVADNKESNIAVNADIELHMGAVPIIESLDVNPREGIALKTLFNYTVTENENQDYPILYKYGYMFGNEVIYITSLLGVTMTEAVLPFAKGKAIQALVQACNSQAICTQIFGPSIHTTQMLFNTTEELELLTQLKQMINRQEYHKFFITAFAVLQSYTGVNNITLLNNMENNITNLTISEVYRLYNETTNDIKSKVLANDLLKHVRLLLDSISSRSDALLNAVVSLRNKLSPLRNLKSSLVNEFTMYSSRKLLAVDETPGRNKRDNNGWTSLEEVRSYILISELIIMTSPDKNRVRLEKQNLLDQLDNLMQGLCTTLYEKPQVMVLELKTVILTIEKINKSNLDKYIHVLFTDNSWKVNGRLKLGMCATESLTYRNQLCIGKAAFKNYFNKRGVVYMAKLYNALPDYNNKALSCDSILVLPVNEKLVGTKEARCAIWENRWLQSHCKTIHSTNITIQCMCNNMEFYTLEYIPVALTTSLIQTTTGSFSTEESRAATLVTEEPIVVDVTLSTVNISSNDVPASISYSNQDEYEIIYYFLIGFSVISIGVLVCAIRYITSKEKVIPVDHTTFYAPLYDDDMLDDIPDKTRE